MSSLWFSVRQYDITSSLFRNILTRRATTPLDSLVLHIIQLRSFSTAATRYGTKNNEQVKEYIAYQQSHGYPESATSASGYIINPAYPFLGASPDGAVYDPSNVQQSFGSVKVKCPYSHRHVSPAEACNTSSFCCELDTTTGHLWLKESHQWLSIAVSGLTIHLGYLQWLSGGALHSRVFRLFLHAAVLRFYNGMLTLDFSPFTTFPCTKTFFP